MVKHYMQQNWYNSIQDLCRDMSREHEPTRRHLQKCLNQPYKDAKSGSKSLMMPAMWFLVFIKKWIADPNKAEVVVKVLWNDFMGIHSVVSDLVVLYILLNKQCTYLDGEE